MRLFVAIDISPAVRDRIERIQRQLQKDLPLPAPAVKWVRPDLIHLTLKFMGEVADRDVTGVCDAVTRTAGQVGPFEFAVTGLGVFGRPARVVWAGVRPSRPLTDLQGRLDRELTKLGGPVENRAFTGHLTVCRVQQASAGRVLADAIGAYGNELLGTVRADEVRVYESVLGRGGPAYHVVSRARLKL